MVLDGGIWDQSSQISTFSNGLRGFHSPQIKIRAVNEWLDASVNTQIKLHTWVRLKEKEKSKENEVDAGGPEGSAAIWLELGNGRDQCVEGESVVPFCTVLRGNRRDRLIHHSSPLCT